MKYKVKEVCIHESKIKAKEKKADIKILENEITLAEKELIRVPDSQHALEGKKNAEKALDIYHIERTRALIIQSRTQIYEEGEKNSKYFLNLVKSSQEKSMIRSLDKNGQTVIDQDKIKTEIEQFYCSLYTKKPIQNPESWIDEIKLSDHFPMISDENKSELAKELNKETLAKIIKSCPKNKSPGNDGLPSEFYVMFWT